jgi:hypothetical protein
MSRISARVRDASGLDRGEDLGRLRGLGHRDHPARLRLHRDGRHVVGDRVVQLAGEREALVVADLALLAGPQVGAIAGRSRQRDHEQDEEEATDDVTEPCRGGGSGGHHAQGDDGGDARHTDRDFPTRAPPHEGVEQDQDRRHRGEAHVAGVGRQLEDRQQSGDPEADQAGGEGMVATPEEGRREAQRERRDERAEGKVWAGNGLDERGSREPAGDEPVHRTHGRGVGGPGLAPDGPADGDHVFRVGTAEVRGQVQAVRRMKASAPSSTAKPRP